MWLVLVTPPCLCALWKLHSKAILTKEQDFDHLAEHLHLCEVGAAGVKDRVIALELGSVHGMSALHLGL